jgi:hypothetical protein
MAKSLKVKEKILERSINGVGKVKRRSWSIASILEEYEKIEEKIYSIL